MKKKNHNVRFITRREFLKRMGLTAAGVTGGALLFTETMAVPEPMLEQAAQGSGIESWVNTVCGQCPGGCGIMVRLIDGIPVYVKGNPHYPVNWGGVCPMAHGAMETLFNPDRLTHPLKQNRGATTEKGGTKIEWEPALAELSKRLKDLKDKGEGHRIAIISGQTSPLARELSRYWLKTLGSANFYEDESVMAHNNALGPLLTQGIEETPAYDLTACKYILNFGANFLEEGTSPVYYQQVLGKLRSVGKETRATLIHIDSRLNLTGAAADRWIPIRPGTYGALALGIAYVLIADELYDKDFIQNHTFGFESFTDKNGAAHAGFKALVRKNYYPEKVSAITGVPAETIIKLAEAFGTHKPAAALGDHASRYADNGSFTQWAVYCLNVLIGNIQKRGGIYFTAKVPSFTFPSIPLPTKAAASLSLPTVGATSPKRPLFGPITVDNFVNSVASGNPGLIDTLIIIDANPMFHSRQKEVVAKALSQIKNVVYMGTFLDETARHAHLVLPDHSFLEKTDAIGPLPGLLFSHTGLQQQVVKPLFNTRQCGDILLETGKTLAGPDAFPWKDYKELVSKRFEVIYKSGHGSIISESINTEWDKYLKERGWKFQQYETFDSFYKLLVKNGGWWNPSLSIRSQRDICHNGSGKFEFYSSTLKQRLQSRDSRAFGGFTGGDDTLMPHYEAPVSPAFAGKFPLMLTVSELLTNREGKGAALPSMMEMTGLHAGRSWRSWFEINPETAKTYGLQDRKPAWLESPRGRVKAEVKIFQGIQPGVVHVHLGFGHTSYGRYGTGIGVNITNLVENKTDALYPAPALNGTPVRISPAED